MGILAPSFMSAFLDAFLSFQVHDIASSAHGCARIFGGLIELFRPSLAVSTCQPFRVPAAWAQMKFLAQFWPLGGRGYFTRRVSIGEDCTDQPKQGVQIERQYRGHGDNGWGSFRIRQLLLLLFVAVCPPGLLV